MANVTVFGWSDDCIELEGDIRDEVSAYNVTAEIWVDDLFVATIGYDVDRDGQWRIQLTDAADAREDADYTLLVDPAVSDDGYRAGGEIPAYSDVLTIDGAFSSVTVHGEQFDI